MSTATASQQGVHTPRSPIHAKPRVADQQMLIGGKWLNSASGKTFETLDPTDGSVICRVAEGDKADIDLAVKAARAAFETGPWGRMDASERGRLLNKLADAIEAHKEELAALESLDNGKPIADSLAADLPLTIQCYRYYAVWAAERSDRALSARQDARRSYNSSWGRATRGRIEVATRDTTRLA